MSNRTRTGGAPHFFAGERDDEAPPGTEVDVSMSGEPYSGRASPEPGKDDDSKPTSSTIVELINDASMAGTVQEKLESLRKAQELLIHQEDVLLDNFLNEMMGFQKDRSQEVRKFVVGFIEEVCKKDPELLPDVIMNIQMMMGDEVVAVQKRVIQAMIHIYKAALMWICKAKAVSDNMEAVWSVICRIKGLILSLLDCENDGVRTYTVKFIEMLIVTQTHVEDESVTRPGDLSLDQVPLTLKIARPRKLEEEARMAFDELLKYHGSAHISSANLMTCMGSLTNIAKVRPQFMPKVITALEMLQANLPPTLAKSQVSSVRKHLKNQLLQLLKHKTAAENFFTNITTLLTDLGATRDEVMKAMPRFEEMKRKAKKDQLKRAAAAERSKSGTPEAVEQTDAPSSKRQRVEEESDDEEEEEEDDDKEKFSQKQKESAVDITEQFILQRMNPTLAAEIVLSSMRFLPEDIPPQFHNTYTPIAAAGTEGQVKHVARLLAAQLTAANIGPGVEEMRERRRSEAAREDDEEEPKENKAKTISVIGNTSVPSKTSGRKKEVVLLPAGTSKKPMRSKSLKLQEMTKPLDDDQKTNLMSGAIRRILTAERTAVMGGIPKLRSKIITTLSAQFSSNLKTVLISYIFDDFKTRADLAFSWLYEEYCFCQGFNKASSMFNRRTDDSEYNSILCRLIRGVIEKLDGSERENFIRRLYLESPIITEEAVSILKQFVQVEGNAITVVNLMKDLVMKRPTKKLNFLNFLLEFCSHETEQVRKIANQIVLQLHKSGEFSDIIEEYSVMYLRFLLNPSPPGMLFGEDRGRPIFQHVWTEEIVKVCLYLFMSLLSQSQKLFKNLADVYAETRALVTVTSTQQQISVQRTILRELDVAVTGVSLSSPDLLNLVNNCPEGSEILVTRIVHILTEKHTPPAPLVEKFRELYQKRMSDVRLLIPVLNGLTKHELIQALPKLIQLSPGVVKEVFTRLLGSSSLKGPFTPAELMICLHNIDVTRKEDKDQMIPAVKRAIDLLFKEKHNYSQEVLSIVLQQLLEEITIPFFMMRTIIQSLKIYPKMVGFIMNVLQKLILKQVWKSRVIWDGFIKLCKETVPQSYAVVLQLPHQQLGDFFDKAPLLREPILEHVQGFNESQRAHVSANTMAVLYNVKPEPTTQTQPAQFALDESNDMEDLAPPGE